MKLRIGVVSAFSDAAETYGHLAASIDCEFVFRTGFLERAATLSLQLLEEEKVDAIITLGIPLEVYNRAILPHIHPVHHNNFDILNAIHDAQQLGEKIAFAEMPLDTILYDWERIHKMLGMDVERYIFRRDPSRSSEESLQLTVDQIITDGNDVMVTMGGYTHAYARRRQFPSLLVKPEPQSFQMVLENINKAFINHRIEIEKNRWLTSVFDSAHEGVTVLDKENRVMAMNASSCAFLKISTEDIIGRPLNEISSPNPLFEKFNSFEGSYEVVKSRSWEYLVKKEVLYDGSHPLGTVLRAQPVKELQEMEMDARRKISESGFVAQANFSDIKGQSPPFQALKDLARRYARSRSNIVLYGESGCGKEIFAQSIHNASGCANGPFVAINCTVLSDALFESELFGYEDGSFTGAKKGGKPGVFEMAHKGTLFLDEIGDMPIDIQAKLLRVLQERTVRRVGGSRNIPVDVRFIFATNRNLTTDIKEGRFRQDLFYRINVLSLKLPPLRWHKDDIRDISLDIVKKLSQHTGKLIVVTDGIVDVLKEYDWPGNIRELTNFWERALFLPELTPEQIRRTIYEPDPGAPAAGCPDATLSTVSEAAVYGDTITLPLGSLRNLEDAVILHLYERYRGSRKQIMKTLGISQSALYRKLKVLNPPPPK